MLGNIDLAISIRVVNRAIYFQEFMYKLEFEWNGLRVTRGLYIQYPELSKDKNEVAFYKSFLNYYLSASVGIHGNKRKWYRSTYDYEV